MPARPPARIALATVERGWAEDDDAPLLLGALAAAGVDAGPASWDDPAVDWSSYDLVVIRSTWDYAERPDEFRSWLDRVAAVTSLANPALVVRWNLDKHHLGQLAAEGCHVVPTTYLDPPGGDDGELGALLGRHREVVVKPTISAGSRDTARYGRPHLRTAVRHARSLLDSGRSVMVQPYLSSVDDLGETGLVFFSGEFSHAFRKGPLLRPGAPLVEGLFAREEIEAREPSADERELAGSVLAATSRILGVGPLPYARVDVIRDEGGRPTLLELELTEPSFFLQTDPRAAARAAATFADLGRAAASARAGGAHRTSSGGN